jgi:hypothetical protein
MKIAFVPLTEVRLQPCHGPSTTRPGAQKPCARKSRVASVGMTEKAALTRVPTTWGPDETLWRRKGEYDILPLWRCDRVG